MIINIIFPANSFVAENNRNVCLQLVDNCPDHFLLINTIYAIETESVSQHNINHLISLAMIIIKQANAMFMYFLLLEEMNNQTNLIPSIKDQNESQ